MPEKAYGRIFIWNEKVDAEQEFFRLMKTPVNRLLPKPGAISKAAGYRYVGQLFLAAKIFAFNDIKYPDQLEKQIDNSFHGK